VERYGFFAESFWRIEAVRYEPERTSWRVLRAGQPWGEFSFALAGQHNVLNATGAAALASVYGISAEQIAEALAVFRSVKRRLEVRAELNGITIIDDFAHHPTAIAETVKALRGRYPGRRLWAVLEPRSNTLRRNVFQHELANSLAMADEVVVAGVFKSDAIPERERLDIRDVIHEVNDSQGHRARYFETADEIVSAITPELKTGDVVAILSNGGFGNIYEKLPERIRAMAAGVSP
jgi:UDP-N-acetylmuramate: L-alanyl-gamma-D-glutamyl-meso-diaminopimelate ligase